MFARLLLYPYIHTLRKNMSLSRQQINFSPRISRTSTTNYTNLDHEFHEFHE